ncbi:MAG: hypothetical protein ACD_60C00128G0019 [uncultured bacterium]|nr:MAG: hypothetical protein ACD_60C00128G0019 [uncultured bacterium]
MITIHLPHNSAKGFTLIELLIVMLIISIVAGIATLTLGSNQHKQYEKLAAEFINKIELAEEEAMLRPATLAVGFTSHAFYFYIDQQDPKTLKHTWQLMKEPALATRNIPSNVEITLKINDKTIEPNGQPAIIISSSLDLTPFVIFIGKKHQKPYYKVMGFANGDLKSERFHEEE